MSVHSGLRHPLCPYCRYDLIATVRAGSCVCPECGETIERHELLHEVRQGDWTDLTGLRRLLISAAWRSLIALVIWSGWFWLVSLWPIQSVIIVLVVMVMHVIMGVIVGKIMWIGLRERCGFDGPVPAAAAVLAVVGVLIAGVVLIGLIMPVPVFHAGLAVLFAGTTALLVIVPSAILEE